MTPAERLHALLERPGILVMPGCHDAMSARLIEEAGFELGFMSGFAVSAARLGMPDTGLISYGELAEQGQNICRAVSIPMIGDGDTGFGSAQNIKRTVQGYARAGFAAIMLEDQVAPKRCGHTEGKAVVGRDEALTRIRAAVDARDEGADILIMARTDARACISLEEAIERCRMFREIGADITFLEAPLNEDEMRRYCEEVDGPKMANLIEGGKTPNLPPRQLEALGYKIAVYPLTLLNVSIQAMREALVSLARSERPPAAMDFEELKKAVGFPDYYAEEARYARGPAGRPAMAFDSRSVPRSRRGRCRLLLRPREALEELLAPLIELFRGQVFLARRDRPGVALRVRDHAGAVAPELVRQRAHRARRHLGARGDGAVEQRVAIVDVEPQRDRASRPAPSRSCRRPSRR